MIHVRETPIKLILEGDSDELATLAYEFRFHPNGYFHSVKYQQHVLTEGKEGWDGYIYPLWRVSRNYCESAVLPRGRKVDLERYAKENKIKLEWELMENPLRDIELDDVRDDLIAGEFKLDERQRLCILEWLRNGVGFCKVSVGGGKTETMAGAAALIKEWYDKARFIYITPSERLVRQTSQRMAKLLPSFEVGQYGGGKQEKDAADMVVCTVSVLHRNFQTLLRDGWFDTFSTLLYDEVHHASAPSSQKVLDVIPAFFRLGASDTAKAKDPAKYFAIRGQFGPRLVEVTSAPLISEGRLAPPHIYVVDMPSWANRYSHVKLKPAAGSKAYVLWDGKWVEGKYRGPVYEVDKKTGQLKTIKYKTANQDDDGNFIVEDRPVLVGGLHQIEIDEVVYEMESRWCLLDRLMDRAVIQFNERNDMIRTWVGYFHKKGKSTVVVATRTAYVYILEALLKKSVDPERVRILTGHEKDSPVQRDEMFQWFKDTPGAVLITPLVKEGISINEISCMVVADFVADPEVARQIIGRAMRPKKKDNRAHVVWFAERQHPQLLKTSRALLKTLEETEGFQYYHPCAGPETVQGKLL